MSVNHQIDPEDMFSDTRMSFGDHLEDLRVHLWRAVIGFFIILVGALLLDGVGFVTGTNFGVGRPMMGFITKPVTEALERYYDKRVDKIKEGLGKGDQLLAEMNEPRDVTLRGNRDDLRRALGLPPIDGAEPQVVDLKVQIKIVEFSLLLHDAQKLFVRKAALTTLSATEAMMVYFKVAIVCGIVISSPWVFWQVWSFIAAGLYPNEKKLVNVYLPFSLGLFLTGIAVCQFLVIPRALDALLWFNEWLDIEPDFRLSEWLSFALLLPLVFGVSFQTPLVMMFLDRIGVMDIDSFRARRKLAWFLMGIFVALITPTPDAVSWAFLWLPMIGLYELGIFLCKLTPRESDLDADVHEPDEMVGV